MFQKALIVFFSLLLKTRVIVDCIVLKVSMASPYFLMPLIFMHNFNIFQSHLVFFFCFSTMHVLRRNLKFECYQILLQNMK